MREYNLSEVGDAGLPTQVGVWGKIKNFLFQEIDLMQEVDLFAPVVLELTPKEDFYYNNYTKIIFKYIFYKNQC